MFTIWGAKQQFCDGLNRRNFLKIGAFGAGLTLADMLRGRAAAAAAGPAHVHQVGHHDLPAGRPVAHGHVRPQAGRARRSSAASSSRSPPTSPACRSASTSRCRRKMWDKLAVHPLHRLRRRALRLAGHDRLQPDRDNRTANHPSFGSVVSQAARRRQRRRAAVRQPARHVAAAPSRASSASRTGRSRPSGPGMQNLRLANGVDRRPARRAQGAARRLRRRPPRHRRHRHHGRPRRLHRAGPSTWSPPARVRNALDLKQGRRQDARALQGRRAVPDRPPAGRGRRRLRHAVASAAGTRTARTSQTLQAAAAAGRPRRRQPDPGPARPRPGQRRGDGHVGRVRPHAEDQHATPAATTGRRSCRPWSPAAA